MPTYLLLGILAGWFNRQQQAVIDYLRAENEILKRQLKGSPGRGCRTMSAAGWR